MIDLINRLHASDPKIVNEAAFEIADTLYLADIPHLVDALSRWDKKTTGALAYAVGELKVQSARDRLIELLQDPRTTGHRGSLVYALMNLDCRNRFMDLLPLIHDDSFEVRCKALIILEKIVGQQTDEILDQARTTLNDRGHHLGAEPEKHFVIDDLLDSIDRETQARSLKIE